MPFRIKSILAASDLSDSASAVLRTAGAFAALTDAELHVIHAVEGDGEEAPTPDQPKTPTQRLEEQIGDAIPSTVDIAGARAAFGHADEVILREADQVGADLIVIGPHRERGGERRTLGTTADRIVRTTDVPCMVVRRPVSLPLRRVLVPSDLSDAASGALDIALVWAAALRMPSSSAERTHLEVIHVVPRQVEGADGRTSAEAERDLRDQVTVACKRVGCGSFLEVKDEVVEAGSADGEILDRIRRGRIDLVVLGTHGESARSRAQIGSVSSSVAREADCPVLLVPPAMWKMRRSREASVWRQIPTDTG